MDWIFSLDFLMKSPSRDDGVTFDLEKAYRAKTTWFIEELGKELKFNRMVVTTAQVLFHRFYVYQSFKQHDRFIISVAALFLAAKVEESMFKYKHLQTVVKAYLVMRRKYFNSPSLTDAEIKDTENKVLVAERIVLQTLCFDLQVMHPYNEAIKKLKHLKSYIPEDTKNDFHSNAVHIINDSYRTTLCLQFSPNQIAVGAIFMAALCMSLQPCNSRSTTTEYTWFELLEVDIEEDSLKYLCEQLLDAYANSSSESVRNIDPKKIQLARSKLQNVNDSMMYNNMCPSTAQPSPNTVTDPPSVPYVYSQISESVENQNTTDDEMFAFNHQSSLLVKRKFDDDAASNK